MLRIFFRHLILVIPLLFFVWPNQVLAVAPNLTSPSDNSTEDKTPKLVWEYSGECVENGSCFRVEVDNNPDFSSPQKSTYTNNFSYSPQGLPEGEWFWRVRAKDKSDKWSEWSRVFKFSTGSTLPSASSSQSPISQPQNQLRKKGNIFEIKELASEINSDQETEVLVLLELPDKLNSDFFLKGAFKKSDSSNYFGETLASDWVKNGSSYSSQFKVETDSGGKWEGKLKVKPDSEDPGFDGSGEYIFKVGRYTDTGSGPSWSNELKIRINEVATPEPSPSEEPEEIEEEEGYPEVLQRVKIASPEYEIKIASVAGEATMSDNMPLITLEEQTRVLEEKKVNWLLIILGIGILVGGAGFGVYQLKTGRK